MIGPRSLEGRVAVVTGGAVRVGRAIAAALAERGASVAITWLSSEAAARAAEADLSAVLAPRGGRAIAVRCDVTREDEVSALFARVEADLGPAQVLVNNAAIFERTPFPDADLASWQRHLDVNLTGGYLCARRAAQSMPREGGGLIVNVACAGGVRPWPGHLAYCVSKAGVVMMTQVLARAVAPWIRVNAVAPGPVLLPEAYGEEEAKAAALTTALRRLGSPEDVARAVLFCWDSEYTTGALIPVEGGRLLL